MTTTSAATTANYVLALVTKAGKSKVAKLTALTADNEKALTAELLQPMATKEIDGLTADILGQESIGKAKDKGSAIARLLKVAANNLPAPAAPAEGEAKGGKAKRAKKAKEPKAPRSFVAKYDPADEGMKKRFADLAPQGRACVLSILGVKREPTEAKEATILATELAGRLDEFKSLFGDSKAKLRRTFAYYAQTLENEGFLVRVGGSHKRATDGYSYEFAKPAPVADAEGAETDDPKWAGLSPIAKTVASIALGKETTVTLTGAELKAKLLKAKLAGKLVTRRDAFLSFQRVEAEMLQANVLRVKTGEEESE